MIAAEPNLHLIQFSSAMFDEAKYHINVYRVIGWEPRNEHGESEPVLMRAIYCTFSGGDRIPLEWGFGQPDTCAQIDNGDNFAGYKTLLFTPADGSMRALIQAANEALRYIYPELPPIPSVN